MSTQVVPQNLARAGLMAAVIATGGNVAIYVVSGLLNVSFTVPAPPGSNEPFTITVLHVIGETILMTVGAAVVFALLQRLTSRPVWVFRVIAVLVLLVSFIFPLLLLVEPPMKIVLCLMHLFSAVVIVSFLTRSAKLN